MGPKNNCLKVRNLRGLNNNEQNMSFKVCWSWFLAGLLQFSADTISAKSSQLGFTC